jgi:hypothetical protein
LRIVGPVECAIALSEKWLGPFYAAGF